MNSKQGLPASVLNLGLFEQMYNVDTTISTSLITSNSVALETKHPAVYVLEGSVDTITLPDLSGDTIHKYDGLYYLFFNNTDHSILFKKNEASDLISIGPSSSIKINFNNTKWTYVIHTEFHYVENDDEEVEVDESTIIILQEKGLTNVTLYLDASREGAGYHGTILNIHNTPVQVNLKKRDDEDPKVVTLYGNSAMEVLWNGKEFELLHMSRGLTTVDLADTNQVVQYKNKSIKVINTGDDPVEELHLHKPAAEEYRPHPGDEFLVINETNHPLKVVFNEEDGEQYIFQTMIEAGEYKRIELDVFDEYRIRYIPDIIPRFTVPIGVTRLLWQAKQKNPYCVVASTDGAKEEYLKTIQRLGTCDLTIYKRTNLDLEKPNQYNHYRLINGKLVDMDNKTYTVAPEEVPQHMLDLDSDPTVIRDKIYFPELGIQYDETVNHYVFSESEPWTFTKDGMLAKSISNFDDSFGSETNPMNLITEKQSVSVYIYVDVIEKNNKIWMEPVFSLDKNRTDHYQLIGGFEWGRHVITHPDYHLMYADVTHNLLPTKNTYKKALSEQNKYLSRWYGIIPGTVWDIKHRPASRNPEKMKEVGDKWFDIKSSDRHFTKVEAIREAARQGKSIPRYVDAAGAYGQDSLSNEANYMWMISPTPNKNAQGIYVSYDGIHWKPHEFMPTGFFSLKLVDDTLIAMSNDYRYTNGFYYSNNYSFFKPCRFIDNQGNEKLFGLFADAFCLVRYKPNMYIAFNPYAPEQKYISSNLKAWIRMDYVRPQDAPDLNEYIDSSIQINGLQVRDDGMMWGDLCTLTRINTNGGLIPHYIVKSDPYALETDYGASAVGYRTILFDDDTKLCVGYYANAKVLGEYDIPSYTNPELKLSDAVFKKTARELVVGGSGENRGIWWSENRGRNWTQSNIGTGSFYRVIWSGSKFIAGSSDGNGIYYSSDGKNWQRSNITTGSWAEIKYHQGIYHAAAVQGASANTEMGIYYSFDGITWNQCKLIDSKGERAFNFGTWFNSLVFIPLNTVLVNSPKQADLLNASHPNDFSQQDYEYTDYADEAYLLNEALTDPLKAVTSSGAYSLDKNNQSNRFRLRLMCDSTHFINQ